MRYRIYIQILTFLFLITGCKYSPLLQKDRYLLHKQSIKGNKHIKKEQFELLIKQKPNRKLPIIGTKPYLYFYLLGEKAYDKKKIERRIVDLNITFNKKMDMLSPEKDSIKIKKLNAKHNRKLGKLNEQLSDGNYLMRVMGEPPVYLDQQVLENTAAEMTTYLQTKGYFFGEVTFKIDTIGRLGYVSYLINEKQVFKIRNLIYDIKDTSISRIINADKETLVKANQNYDEENLTKERERIYKLLKNNGYFDFTRQYVYMDVDSIGLKNQIDLVIYVQNPTKSTFHTQYAVKSIYMIIDKNNKRRSKPRVDTILFNGVNYEYYYRYYSKRVINSKIAIKAKELYNLTNSQKTQNRISQLDMFSFVNLNYQKVDGDSLIAYINTSSLSRYQLSDEWGVTTNINQQIPGPFGSITFLNRNTFKGCELFDFNIRGGIEGQASALDANIIYRTRELSSNSSLTLPKLLLPGKYRFIFNDFNPKTKFTLSYINTERPEYIRTNIRGNYSYIVQPGFYSRLIITPLEVNIVNAKILDPLFQTRLVELSAKGNNLLTSFTRSIITNMGLTYTYNNNDLTKNRRAHFFRATAEFGGLMPNLLSQIVNEETISKRDSLFGLPYFKFWKLQADYRFYQPIGKKNTIAFRIMSGIVAPYDGYSFLPYEKYFFSGGSNSNRAWSPRRLGPGSYAVKNADGSISYSFEQPGEIIMEANLEGRFKIYKFIAGAIFSDVGNVWAREKTASRPNAEFKLDRFYREIAVGAGLGIRLDFSFLIFRLDAGIKMYDPGREEGEKLRINKISLANILGKGEQTIYNISIGYPF